MLFSMLIPPSKISDLKSGVIICQNQAGSLLDGLQFLQTIQNPV